MAEFKSYSDLEVWKESRKLVKHTYQITELFPKKEIYGLSQQMQRCAVSVPSNIAEGYGRNGIKDSLRFFYISRGSIYELETQFYLAQDLAYINETTLKQTLEMTVPIKRMLGGLIRYYRNKL